jgi:hypothetical protein
MSDEGKVTISTKILGWIGAAFAAVVGLLLLTRAQKNAAEAKNEIANAKIEDAKLEERHETLKQQATDIKTEPKSDKLSTGTELADWYVKRFKNDKS